MNEHAAYLADLGRKVLEPYTKLPGCACAIITGSVAEGNSDEYSDLDLILHYTSLPPVEQIRGLRERVGGGPIQWSIGEPSNGEFIDSFRVKGVECQLAHATVAKWEADIARTLAGEEPGSPLHKAMSGTLCCLPVFGEDVLRRWQAQLRDYPDALAIAMVNHHLKFFPAWALHTRLSRRDANLWFRQSMVESSFNILGVLAGLNRKFFTTFQFKRMRRFTESLAHAPRALANRLDALWTMDLPDALQELRALVAETIELVEKSLPQIDTRGPRKALERKDVPWQMER